MNIASLGGRFFRLENPMPTDSGVWDFMEKALAKGKHIFLYLTYEAFQEDKPDNLPYPAIMAWEATPIEKQEWDKQDSDEDTRAIPTVAFDISFSMDYEEYKNGFGLIKDYLKNGYSYQVNYTFPMLFKYQGSWVRLTKQLLKKQQTEFSGFLKFGSRLFISSSPELFFRIENNKIITEPMKGTWPASQETPGLDKKTIAENIMIVDLIRNDLGKICKTGSIKTELFKFIRLPGLWQLVSKIEGGLEENISFKEIFSALFPSGSVTGAPKKSTQVIIKEVEKDYRGIYTGTMGWISPGNRALFNVCIRTADIDIKKQEGRLGIGSGVVWDSLPEKEYAETLSKSDFFTQTALPFKLIETMGIENNQIKFRELHLKRLKASAKFFGFRYNEKEILSALQNALRSAEKEEIYKLRLTLDFYGNIETELSLFQPEKKIFVVGIYPNPLPPNNILLYHKTTMREEFNKALSYAKERGWDEAILINEEGFITQGTFTNVFIEKKGIMLTPGIEHGLLPGVLRQDMLNRNIAKEAKLRPEDLKDGNIFVGNALRGLIKAEARI